MQNVLAACFAEAQAEEKYYYWLRDGPPSSSNFGGGTSGSYDISQSSEPFCSYQTVSESDTDAKGAADELSFELTDGLGLGLGRLWVVDCARMVLVSRWNS